jgi:hypothetical protein
MPSTITQIRTWTRPDGRGVHLDRVGPEYWEVSLTTNGKISYRKAFATANGALAHWEEINLALAITNKDNKGA